MIRAVFISILCLAALLVSSCKKIIEVELDEEDRRLVVQAWFTTEQKVHEIRLTQSTSYYDTEEIPQVSGAKVSISGGGETFIFTEAQPGVYHSEPTAHAKQHTSYTLTIQYNGQTYEATDYCDTVPQLEQIFPEPDYNDQGQLERYDILIWTTELAGYGDHYAWRALVNGNYVSDTLGEIDFGSDDYVGDGLYFEAWPITTVDYLYSGDTLTLEQHNISKATYDAFVAVMLETSWRNGFFDSPPSNIPTNLSNGALGLFMVSAMHSAEYVVP
jgi:hypothetical protein